MTLVIALTVATHLVLPPLLIYWIYKSKAESRAHWITAVLLTGSYLFMLFRGGAAWSWFGHVWPIAFLGLFVLVTIRGLVQRRHLPWWPFRWQPWFLIAIYGVLTSTLIVSIVQIEAGRIYPKAEAVTLFFPLTGGTFHIGQGGTNTSVNHHYAIRAQKYALDIVKLNELGVRAKGLLPKKLERYVIFGSEVIAPCAGEVIGMNFDKEDLIPPDSDPENPLGNHVILACKNGEEEVSVLLAHLKRILFSLAWAIPCKWATKLVRSEIPATRPSPTCTFMRSKVAITM